MASKAHRNLLCVNSSAHTHIQHTFRCDCHYCSIALCAVRYVTFLRPHITAIRHTDTRCPPNSRSNTTRLYNHLKLQACTRQVISSDCFIKISFNIPLLPHFRTLSSPKILFFLLTSIYST